MTESYQEDLLKAIGRAREILGERPTLGGLARVLQEGAEFAEKFAHLTGQQKRCVAIELASHLVQDLLESESLTELVREVDLPGPEWLERVVWDPLALTLLRKVLGPAIVQALPDLFDLVIGASKGELELNREDLFDATGTLARKPDGGDA